MRKEVMIDLETLSTAPNSVILTIAAIQFERNEKIQPIEKMIKFYRKIDIKSCTDVGLHTSKETQEWWKKQPEIAREEALGGEDRQLLTKVLNDFSEWYKTNNCGKIWSHGDDFDCVILNSAFSACNIKVPWKFWETRDTRTLFDLAKQKLKNFPVVIKHHALHDAYSQILAAKKSFKILENSCNK